MQFTPYVKGTILENVDNNGFLRRNLLSCPQDGKKMAYKGLVQPILEYTSPVWDPHGIVVQEELEKVQLVQLGLWLYLPLWNWKYDWHSWTVRHVRVSSQKTQR